MKTTVEKFLTFHTSRFAFPNGYVGRSMSTFRRWFLCCVCFAGGGLCHVSCFLASDLTQFLSYRHSLLLPQCAMGTVHRPTFEEIRFLCVMWLVKLQWGQLTACVIKLHSQQYRHVDMPFHLDIHIFKLYRYRWGSVCSREGIIYPMQLWAMGILNSTAMYGIIQFTDTHTFHLDVLFSVISRKIRTQWTWIRYSLDGGYWPAPDNSPDMVL